MTCILIVDDDPSIREMVGMALTRKGYTILEAGDASEARSLIESKKPDLLLLDWMLPGQSGLELARRLHKDHSDAPPVIMLTARDQETDMIAAFDIGADDYVSKPFSVNELLARIKAVLRRSAPQPDGVLLEIDGLLLDADTRRVTAAGNYLDLPPAEFRLLHFFLTHRERVYSRRQLIEQVWNTEYVEERTVDVHIRRLRKILQPSGHDRLIQTVRGAGYRLSAR